MAVSNKLGFHGAVSLLWRTAKYMGPHIKVYTLGMLLACSEMGALFAAPELSRLLVLMVTGQTEKHTVQISLLLFVLLFALVPVTALGKYLQGISAAHGLKNLRQGVFSHLQSLSITAAGNNRTGGMIARLTNDTEQAGAVFQSFAIVSLVRFVSVVSVSWALLLAVDWRIALLGFVYNGLCFFLASRLNPYVRSLERDAREYTSSAANHLLEAARGRAIVRVFLLAEILVRKFEKVCREIMRKRIRFRFMNGLSYGIIDLFVFSAQGLAFLLGISFGLIAGGIEGGIEGRDLAACVYAASLMGVMSNAVLSGSSFLLMIQPSLAAASRVFEVLDMKGEADRPDTAVPDENYPLAVEFNEVSFTYQDGTKALVRVSLKIKRGEHIALVGGSGCGKSTLLKLIQALYEPTEGRIVLFGADTLSLSLGTIRSLSAVVNQECTVFDDTIRTNIGYGKNGALEADIIQAARTAGIHDFIKSLPEGCDTLIGEQGARLSGGQRQRIAIARAVLKGAPLLLMDEATASLDSAAEAEIYKNLAPLIKLSTSITAAHRLSTVKNADRILVFENGRIVEEGTHEELTALGGHYKRLYDAQ